MNILLVAATEIETQLIRETYPFSAFEWGLTAHVNTHQVDLIHTGIGMVNTAFALGEYLATHAPQLAIHVGISGSFDLAFKLGQVVELVEDSFSEIGAEDGNQFLDLETMGFPLFKKEERVYFQTLTNPKPSQYDIPKTTGITVNTVHGEKSSIASAQTQWGKQIETMESAAFFLAMIKKDIPFYSFRGISNYVTPRDKSQWKIKESAQNVQQFLINRLKTDLLSI